MKSLISGRYQKSEKTAMGEVFDFLKKYDDIIIGLYIVNSIVIGCCG